MECWAPEYVFVIGILNNKILYFATPAVVLHKDHQRFVVIQYNSSYNLQLY